MSVKYRTAKDGKRFVLTLAGFAQPKVRMKFEKASPFREKYEKKCPRSWVDAGYVMEVDK